MCQYFKNNFDKQNFWIKQTPVLGQTIHMHASVIRLNIFHHKTRAFFTVLRKCVFRFDHCQGQPFLFSNLFLWRNDGECWYLCICTSAREICFVRVISAGHRTVPRLFSYNAGRATADAIIYRRRPAPVRYVTRPARATRARVFIKFTGDLQIA